MNVEVNMAGVFLAAVASMIFGGIWFSQPVFGKTWMKLVGLDFKKSQKGLPKALVQGAICALLTAYVLAHVAFLSNQFFQNSFMSDAVSTAFWVGLGFSVTTVVALNAFEQRDKKLTVTTAAHQLVGFLIMGVVIGAFHP